MKNVMWKETSLSSVLILLLLLFINPFEVFGMPTVSQMILLSIFSVLFMIFVAFVWRENSLDERESHHVFLAGRFAFLAGTSVLTIGMIIQIVSRTLDMWIPAALAVMIFSKMGSLAYFRKNC